MSETSEYLSHVWVPMPDGARLGARVWLPVDARTEPVPAVLEYIPYRKDDCTVARDSSLHPDLVTHGYACVRVDMRGSGSSDGVKFDEYSEQEMQDGEDVLRWIADQPWCNGRVGMIGISWGGITGLQLASRDADHLEAVIALGATEHRYYDDGGYYLGCMVGQTIGWASMMFAYNARPPDPLHCGTDWRDLWMRRLQEAPLYLSLWLDHQREDDYWLRGSVGVDYSAVQTPVFAVSGHADCWPNTVGRLLENLPGPRRGLQGPWAHRYPQMAIPGPAIDFMPEVVRWFDHWLKGEENGADADPMYRVFMQESVRPATFYAERPGRWIAEPTWPSPQVERHAYHLGAYTLTTTPSPALGPMTVSSPQTVGLAGGEYMPWFNFGPGAELPDDQRIEDDGSLVFDSEPLTHAVEILGVVSAQLTVSSDKPQALIAVRLCDVWPDGASTLITRGVLNLSQRDSKADPEPMPIGAARTVDIDLDHVAYSVPAGHHIRLSISTSYWPIAWPAPERATVTVHADESVLTIPQRDLDALDASAPPFRPAPSSTTTAVENLGAFSERRSTTVDEATGATTMEIVTDNGRLRFPETGLEMASQSVQRFTIRPDDPLSACAHYEWRWEFERDDWHTRTDTSMTMTCSESTFDVVAELIAHEGDVEVFRRSWDEQHPRDHF